MRSRVERLIGHIGTDLYTFIDNAMANHANAITQRTVSDRVKIPAKAQNDSTIKGADKKNNSR